MKQIYKNLFAGLFTLSLFLPLTAQFQNLYTTGIDSSSGDMRRVAVVNRVGAPNEYCIIGTDFNRFPAEGTLCWIDEAGDPILFRRMTPRSCQGTNDVFGRDVCEASFDPEITLTAFYEEGTCGGTAFPRSTLVYFDETTRSRVLTRAIPGFEVQAMISNTTLHPTARVFMVGNATDNGAILVHASDAAGNTVWSQRIILFDASGVSAVQADAHDIVYVPNLDRLVVTGTINLTSGVEEAFLLELNSSGGSINPFVYQMGGGSLSGNTIALANTGGNEIIIGGTHRIGNGPNMPAFLSIDVTNPFVPLSELYLDPTLGGVNAEFTVEDLASNFSGDLVAVGTATDQSEQGYTMLLTSLPGNPLTSGPLLIHDGGTVSSFTNRLHGITYNPNTVAYPTVGFFASSTSSPFPTNHWALGLNPDATSNCSDPFSNDRVGVTSSPFPLIFGNQVGPVLGQANIRQRAWGNAFAPQCPGNKFAGVSLEPEEDLKALTSRNQETLSFKINGLTDEEASVWLGDINGRKLWTGETQAGELTLSTTDLPSGTLFLTWETSSGKWGTKKVVLIR